MLVISSPFFQHLNNFDQHLNKVNFSYNFKLTNSSIIHAFPYNFNITPSAITIPTNAQK